MGYFNYFIKCIIRKFVNIFFKPKTMLIILIVIFLLYLFCGTARAEWTDDKIQRVIEDLESIAGSNIETYQLLEQISTSVEGLPQRLEWINGDLINIRDTLYSISEKTTNINTELKNITSQLTALNTEISNIYNDLKENHQEVISKLDENQQQLLAELEEDNKAVLEELNMIRDAINGSEEEQTTFNDLGTINSSSYTFRVKAITLNYESRYTYNIKIYINNTSSNTLYLRAYTSDNLLPDNFTLADYYNKFIEIDSIPPNTENYIVNYEVSSTNPTYIYLGGYSVCNYIEKIEVSRSIKGIIESLNQSNNLQQEQNQLQQQQNQLQQEQNNFLQQGTSDSDVSVDSFNNVDSNDITSAGLTGVFNNIYSSITSWNAKNISLPIPHTNKSIVIPANYTESMLSSSGGGWIITFVHAVYYFIVGKFMIYSITNIINSIKSGSILNTDSKNNITTDML